MMSGMCIDGQRGRLVYDPAADRPLVAFARGGYSGELNCGQPITLVRGGTIYETRLELDEDGWYYPGTNGLRAQMDDLVYLP